MYRGCLWRIAYTHTYTAMRVCRSCTTPRRRCKFDENAIRVSAGDEVHLGRVVISRVYQLSAYGTTTTTTTHPFVKGGGVVVAAV